MVALQLRSLQASAGNQAVLRFLRRAQAKLEVGDTDDPLEAAADRAADRAVEALRETRAAGISVPSTPTSGPTQAAPLVRRAVSAESAAGVVGKDGTDGGEIDPGLERAVTAASGGGQPLHHSVRQHMEGALGADFSRVRIHTGPESAQMNGALQARAFTVGSDIFFNGTAPDTRSESGQHLLAHELSHVVQQGASGGGAAMRQIQRKGDVRNFFSATTAKLTKKITGTSGQKTGKTLTEVTDPNTPVTGAFKAHAQTRGTDAQLEFLRAYRTLMDGAGAEITYGEIDTLLTAYNGRVPGLDYSAMGTQGGLYDAIRTKKLFAMQGGPDAQQPVRTAAVRSILSNIVSRAEGNLRQTVDSYNQAHGRAAAPGLAPAPTDDQVFAQKGVTATQYKTSNIVGTPTQLGSGSVNTVWEHHYNHDATPQVFKGDSDVNEFYGRDAGTQVGIPENNPEFAKRSVAMYKLDQLLGLNIISKTAFAVHGGEFGTVMDKAEGKAYSDLSSKDPTAYARIKDDANFQSALTKLQLLDIICGQLDRHTGNYFVKYDPVTKNFLALSGIDNDMAFGSEHTRIEQEVGKGWTKNDDGSRSNKTGTKGKMGGSTSFEAIKVDRVVDRGFIDTIIRLDLSTVRNALQGLLADSEITATVQRTRQLQMYLKDVVSQQAQKEIANIRNPQAVPASDLRQGIGLLAMRYRRAKRTQNWQEAYDILMQLRQRMTRLEMAAEANINTVPLDGGDLNHLSQEINFVAAKLRLPRQQDTLPGGAQAITARSTPDEAAVLWASLSDDPQGRVAKGGATVQEAMRALWVTGDDTLRGRIVAVLKAQGDQLRMSHIGYVLEALDTNHRVTLPTSFGTWAAARDGSAFFTWLATNPPGGDVRAKYYTAQQKDDARIRFKGGRLSTRTADDKGAMAERALNTSGDGWVVVLDSSGEFYTNPKGQAKGEQENTQHSSFLGGIPVESAGMLRSYVGRLQFVTNHSGHYRPTTRHLVKMCNAMEARGVDMSGIEIEDKDRLRTKYTGIQAFLTAAGPVT